MHASPLPTRAVGEFRAKRILLASEPIGQAAKMLRGTKRMRVTSKAGTSLDVDMVGAATVGVWGWTDKTGTLAHWPGGIVVSFPKSGTVNE